MPLDPRKVESSLLKKGFTKDSRNHHYFYFEYDDKLVARTHMSHNGQEISDSLISAMKRQCHLDKKDFLDLVNCPMSREDYIGKLKKANII